MTNTCITLLRYVPFQSIHISFQLQGKSFSRIQILFFDMGTACCFPIFVSQSPALACCQNVYSVQLEYM